MAWFDLTTAVIEALPYDSSRQGGSITITNLSPVRVYYGNTAEDATSETGGIIEPGGVRVQDKKPQKALFLSADFTQVAPNNTRVTVE